MTNFPICPMLCTSKEAKWHGKWFANMNTEVIKQIGGPWDSADSAADAIQAAWPGAFRREVIRGIVHLYRV